MSTASLRGWYQSREAAGFLVSIGFVCLAAVRDVYLGGLFQRASPLLIAIVAFTLCTLVFLPIALVHSRDSLGVLLRRPRDLFWVNVTSAIAWLTFFAALRLIEPSLVQILYSGIGPLSVVWIDRHFSGARPAVLLTCGERPIYFGLAASLVFSAAVALCGLSGAGAQPVGDTVLGVVLAASGGISISVSTMLCRKLNDAGVTPSTLLSLRYPATALSAAVIASLSSSGLPAALSLRVDVFLAIASLLIVVPSYVNQVGISLASPLTVRVVLSVGPVLIFLFQLVEGRLSASPYSLAAAILYAVVAISAGFARQRAIRHPPGPTCGPAT
jgi:drug/metabolite transporter (DMT)-like permease